MWLHGCEPLGEVNLLRRQRADEGLPEAQGAWGLCGGYRHPILSLLNAAHGTLETSRLYSVRIV